MRVINCTKLLMNENPHHPPPKPNLTAKNFLVPNIRIGR